MGDKKKILIMSQRERMDIYKGFCVEGTRRTKWGNVQEDASFGSIFPNGKLVLSSGYIFIEIYELIDIVDPGPGGIGID